MFIFSDTSLSITNMKDLIQFICMNLVSKYNTYNTQKIIRDKLKQIIPLTDY